MSHGRKPRRPRWPAKVDTLQAAINGAAKLTPAEVATAVTPARNAFAKVRIGQGSRNDWLDMAATVTMALSIEDQGVVRGLREHLNAADEVLTTLASRANLSTGWRPPALSFNEIETLQTLVELFEFQLSNLSGKEFAQAHTATLSRNIQAGGSLGQACRESLSNMSRLQSAATGAIA